MLAALILLLPADVPDLKLPDGFTLAQVLTDADVPDCYCLTADEAGALFAGGPGYVRKFVPDGAGGYVRHDFAAWPPQGAQGLSAEGATLFVTGGRGVERLTDADGDHVADGPPELVLACKTGGEHDAHAVRRCPHDGRLYLIAGNMTTFGTDDDDLSDADTVFIPRSRRVAGVLVRLAEGDTGPAEIVAHGFRNAYDFDFGADANEFYVWDSDNERCVGLPWYEPCRLYRVRPGSNAGWLSPHRADTWRLPSYYFDVATPVAWLGRGSPTGVLRYPPVVTGMSRPFPAKYHGQLLLADWTFGVLHAVTPSGATSVLAQPSGTDGFAPTDLVVDPPTGDLLVSIGGRGTTGGVFRLAFEGIDRAAGASSPQDTVGDGAPSAAAAIAGAIRRRMDSPEVPTVEQLRPLAERAAAGDAEFAAMLAPLLARCPDWGQALGIGDVPSMPTPGEWSLLKARDRLGVRVATLTDGRKPVQDETLPARPGQRLLEYAHAVVADSAADTVRVRQLARGGIGRHGRLDQGYRFADGKAARRPRVAPDPEAERERPEGAAEDENVLYQHIVLTAFAMPTDPADAVYPSLSSDLPRRTRIEAARLMAALGDGGRIPLLERIASESNPIDQTHYLICLSRLPAGPENSAAAQTVTDALVALPDRLDALGIVRDRHWPQRMSELFVALLDRDPQVGGALLAHPKLVGEMGVLLAPHLKEGKAAVADRFVSELSQSDRPELWSTDLVDFLQRHATARDGLRTLVRSRWENPVLQAAVTKALAADPVAEDRQRFVDALSSGNGAAVTAGYRGLSGLRRATHDYALAAGLGKATAAEAGRHKPVELFALASGLTELETSGDEQADELRQYLKGVTGRALPSGREYRQWLTTISPDAAPAEAEHAGLAQWLTRAETIDWSAGDAARGLAQYRKLSCVQCHGSGNAVGPRLEGVAQRLKRDDLLTAIVAPDRDVPDRYRAEKFATTDGEVLEGVVIYEAASGLILQTAAGRTVRLAPGDVAVRRESHRSLMPGRLLDQSSDRDVADLFAYLRTLTK